MKALFFKDVQDLLPAFASIAAITLLGGVVAAIGNASGGVGNISFLVLFSAALLPVLVVMTQCFTAAKSALESMNRQIQIVFPILLTIDERKRRHGVGGYLHARRRRFFRRARLRLYFKRICCPSSVTYRWSGFPVRRVTSLPPGNYVKFKLKFFGSFLRT